MTNPIAGALALILLAWAVPRLWEAIDRIFADDWHRSVAKHQELTRCTTRPRSLP